MAEEKLSAAQRSRVRRLSIPKELAPDEERGHVESKQRCTLPCQHQRERCDASKPRRAGALSRLQFGSTQVDEPASRGAGESRRTSAAPEAGGPRDIQARAAEGARAEPHG